MSKQHNFNVYYRNDDSTLGKTVASRCYDHEDAIMFAKEHLVAMGDGLDKKAVLAVLEGGKSVK